jgi:hypothetical protein
MAVLEEEEELDLMDLAGPEELVIHRPRLQTAETERLLTHNKEEAAAQEIIILQLLILT